MRRARIARRRRLILAKQPTPTLTIAYADHSVEGEDKEALSADEIVDVDGAVVNNENMGDESEVGEANYNNGVGGEDDNDLSDGIDRSWRVTVSRMGKKFPAPDSFDFVDVAVNPELYGKVPCFGRDAVQVVGLLDESSNMTCGFLTAFLSQRCVLGA